MANSSSLELSPQIWNWYVGFFETMGAVFSLAMALASAVLIIHWLYICAQNLESEPTPTAFIPAVLRLSAFQALILGAFLVPVGVSLAYYLLASVVWKLTPAQVEAPPLDFGAMSVDDQISSMASLSINLLALAGIIVLTVFLLLRYGAQRLNRGDVSLGFIKRFLRTYFYESPCVGFSLMLIACPVLWYFLYNTALLIMVVVPAVRHELPRIGFSGAENLYIKGLTRVGSLLIVVLFVPAAVLMLRGLLLRWRYTLENPFLRRIFIRSLKFALIGFFCWLGGFAMYFLADASFMSILRVN